MVDRTMSMYDKYTEDNNNYMDVYPSVKSTPSFERIGSEGSDGGASETGEDESNISVIVRVRPVSAREVTAPNNSKQNIIQFPGEGGLVIDNGMLSKSFTFNVTFEPDATQGDVFQHSGVKRLVDMALNGYSCTAFAFGQTGSGKTHTMTGPPQQATVNTENMGIIPLSFHYLFDKMNQRPGTTYRINVSYLEIYNETVIDLLNTNQRRSLMVRWSKHRGFYVENLFVVECEGVDDLLAVLEEGITNRQSGSHSLNECSSRSHALLTLMIDSDVADPDDPNLYITKHGKLTFVDLAGSEKVKDATNEHLVESNNINKSLLVLGKCISALGDPKKRQGHIPYRDSKLTKLLADSLGGNGVTLMIACVSPSQSNAAESMNTLRYANRAKRIKNKPLIKMDPRERLIMSMKRELKVLKKENEYLRQQLEFPVHVRENGLRDPAVMRRELTNMMQKQQQQQQQQTERAQPEIPSQGQPEVVDHGLYEMLQEYMIENETLRSENTDLHGARDSARRDQQILAHDNERLMRKLEELERLLAQSPVSYNGGMYSSRHSSYLDSLYSGNASPVGFAPAVPWQQPGQPVMIGQPQIYYNVPIGTPPYQPLSKPSSPSQRNAQNGATQRELTSPRRPGPAPQYQYPARPPHRLADSLTQNQPQRSVRHQKPTPRQSFPRVSQEQPKYGDKWQQRVEYYNSRNQQVPVDNASRNRGGNKEAPPSNPGTRPTSKAHPQSVPQTNQASPPTEQHEISRESPEETNERLQQELLDLQSQIRNQHQIVGSSNTSVAGSKRDEPEAGEKRSSQGQVIAQEQSPVKAKPRSNIPQPRSKKSLQNVQSKGDQR